MSNGSKGGQGGGKTGGKTGGGGGNKGGGGGNPNYPAKTGKVSGKGRGNAPKK